MSYQITILKTEPNPDFGEELKQYKQNCQWNMDRGPEPRRDLIKDALIVELTDDQYRAVKAAIVKTFE